MSDEEIDLPTVDFSNVQQTEDVERANLSLKLLPNGKIDIDWTGFPRHPSCQQFIVHYRSLNDNHVKKILFFNKRKFTSKSIRRAKRLPLDIKNVVLFYKDFLLDIFMKFTFVPSIDRRKF